MVFGAEGTVSQSQVWKFQVFGVRMNMGQPNVHLGQGWECEDGEYLDMFQRLFEVCLVYWFGSLEGIGTV